MWMCTVRLTYSFFPCSAQCRITSTNPSTALLIPVEHSVQVLTNLLGNPPTRAFLLSENLLFDTLVTSGTALRPASAAQASFNSRGEGYQLGLCNEAMKGCHRFKKYTVQVRRFAIRDSSFRRLDFSGVGLSLIYILTYSFVIVHTRERNAQKCSVYIGAP
ncbi:hypothetical protein BGY98DRAFT_1042599 [Russula aff. rugulosa BPL654]|nr:hypothetical protein BGY98DRAFT_1042599 [Russula aff. rugulosa BPL654]